MKKIVVTGGIASGKSTVCRMLRQKRGVYHLDSDEVIHRLLSEDQPTIRKIVNILGPDILFDGKVDRKQVAKIVFLNAQKLKAVEEVLHPKLFNVIMQQYTRVQNLGSYRFFVVEMALIQEIDRTKFFNTVVSILCDETQAKKRSFLSEQEYKIRMQHQWPINKKALYADYVILNNGSIQKLQKHVLDFFETINKQENISQ